MRRSSSKPVWRSSLEVFHALLSDTKLLIQSLDPGYVIVHNAMQCKFSLDLETEPCRDPKPILLVLDEFKTNVFTLIHPHTAPWTELELVCNKWML